MKKPEPVQDLMEALEKSLEKARARPKSVKVTTPEPSPLPKPVSTPKPRKKRAKPPVAQAGPPIDLMEALEKSLERVRSEDSNRAQRFTEI